VVCEEGEVVGLGLDLIIEPLGDLFAGLLISEVAED
jgi:hypothetical protein